MSEKERGSHPDEMLLSSREIERRKQWCAQDSRQKEYGRGHDAAPQQLELSLDLNIRGNYDLPCPPKEQDAIPLPDRQQSEINQINSATVRRFHKHFRRTIIAGYRAEVRKIAEKNWQEGQRDTTVLKDRDIRVPSHSRNQKNHPLLPKKYQESAKNSYPIIPAPYRELLYLHNVCQWGFGDIAFHFNSSSHQIEQAYIVAHEQDIVTSLRCPLTICFKKE